MKRIVIVEDDPILCRALALTIEGAGYAVEIFNTLGQFNSRCEGHHYDLLILDIGLPDGNGIEALKELREKGLQTPIILLTARDHEDSVVAGLSAGANDYVKKPYSNKELTARIKAALRDTQFTEKRIRVGELNIQVDKRKVFIGTTEIKLNRRQFDILLYLTERQGMVISRETLIQTVKKDGEMFDRTIDSHISHLRSVLKKSGVATIAINSVYGIGYRLEIIERTRCEA